MIENGFSIYRDTRFSVFGVAVEGGRRGGGWGVEAEVWDTRWIDSLDVIQVKHHGVDPFMLTPLMTILQTLSDPAHALCNYM